MRRPVLLAAFMAGCFAASPASATVTINFENIGTYGVNTGISILNFYNGGTASNGHTDTNLGVSFATNAQTLCLNTPGTMCSAASRGGVGDPASADTGMLFQTGTSTFLSDAAGFSSGISFYYVANIAGTVQIFDNVSGTGNLLATLALPTNATGCRAPYNADYCPFSLVTLGFSGTGRSVVFGGTAGHIVFDDISLGVVSLPEPASWAMMLMGFGAVGAALRFKRRRKAFA
jgi:PEP-CTERM motif